jgi:hypothetical protein
MTRWLQAARQSTGGQTQPAYPTWADAENEPQERVLSVLSVLSQGEHTPARPAEITATLLRPKPEPSNVPKSDAFPYGTACNLGYAPRTWTGRIVSLDEWRRLTEWEKHGSNGRHWNGITGQWEQPETGAGPSKPKTI